MTQVPQIANNVDPDDDTPLHLAIENHGRDFYSAVVRKIILQFLGIPEMDINMSTPGNRPQSTRQFVGVYFET